jgi:hypothetical protein
MLVAIVGLVAAIPATCRQIPRTFDIVTLTAARSVDHDRAIIQSG